MLFKQTTFNKRAIFMVIGHSKVLEYFESAIKDQRLAHGYALVGRPALGKMALAKELAAKILAVPVEKLATHPDFTQVARLTDEKTGKLKTEISVAQARELKNVFSKKSWIAEYRVCIIDEADKISSEAANGLLKLLEEPSIKAVIFLLAEDDADILPTVKSRVQIFNLLPVSERAIKKGLQEIGWSEKEIESVMPFVFGRPGVALALLSEESELLKIKSEYERFSDLKKQPFYLQTKRVEDLFGKAEEGERTTEKLSGLFDWWSLWWKQDLEKVFNGSVNEKQAEPKKIVQILDSLSEGKKFLAEQVNPRLVLENIVSQF